MWHDHPFSQRNKATKRALELEVGGKIGWGGRVKQNLKKWTDNTGGVFKKKGGGEG